MMLDGTDGVRPVPAPWAGALLALGARIARCPPAYGDQLVVAVTVPIRDYAAVLVAIGWLLAQRIALPPEPPEMAASIAWGTPVRMIAGGKLVADRFFELRESAGGPRVRVGRSSWQLDHVEYLVPVPCLSEDRFCKVALPTPGTFLAMTGRLSTWPVEHALATCQVSVVGTRTWLMSETYSSIGWGNSVTGLDRIGDLLRIDDGHTPCWSSVILPAGTAGSPQVADSTAFCVLDGSTAIRWLHDIVAPMVVAVADRSSSDELAGELITQARATAMPLKVSTLGWSPPGGLEAVAFTRPR